MCVFLYQIFMMPVGVLNIESVTEQDLVDGYKA